MPRDAEDCGVPGNAVAPQHLGREFGKYHPKVYCGTSVRKEEGAGKKNIETRVENVPNLMKAYKKP